MGCGPMKHPRSSRMFRSHGNQLYLPVAVFRSKVSFSVRVIRTSAYTRSTDGSLSRTRAMIWKASARWRSSVLALVT